MDETPPHALLLPLCTTGIVCVEVCPPVSLHDTLSPFVAVSTLKLNVVANTGGLIEINSAENMNPDACKYQDHYSIIEPCHCTFSSATC